MTLHIPTLSTRARRALAASSIALLAAGLAVAPATADPGCDTFASTGEDYEAELACASGATEGEQVITLTDSFTVAVDAFNIYEGTQPLTITAEPGVVITGAPDVDVFDTFAGSFLVAPPVFEPEPTFSPQSNEDEGQPLGIESFESQIQALEQESAPLAAAAAAAEPRSITIENVTLRGFGNFGTIAVLTETPLYIVGSTIEDNGPEIDLDEPPSYEAGLLATIAGVGEITIENSTISGNRGLYGAGVSNVIAQLVGGFEMTTFPGITITDSTFDGNAGLIGSAVLSLGAVEAHRSSFTNNVGQLGSAIIAGEGLALRDSTVAGNDARAQSESDVEIGQEGGAVAVMGGFEGAPVGAVEVTNSTFANNLSEVGTLVAPAVDTLSIESSTFVDNTVVEPEGGDVVVEENESAVITGTVFSSEEANACATLSEAADAITTSYVFDDGSCSAGWSGEGDLGEGLDAQLGTLADNGGPTATALPSASSPLIDAVPADALVTQVDQRGIARPQGSAGDIGAVEVEVADAGDLVEFQIKTDSGTILGTATPAIDVTGIQWIPVAELDTAPPADTMFPYGAAAFSVQVPQAGDSVTITLTAPRPFTTALKSGEEWTEVAGATYSQDRTTVTYTLTDGGELDEDGTANGTIVDPIALAVQGTFTG